MPSFCLHRIALAATFFVATACVAQQTSAAEPQPPAPSALDSPANEARNLVEKASDLIKQSKSGENRYTYLIFHNQTIADKDGRITNKFSNEFELTWLGNQPYMRLRAINGRPLEGRDLAKEAALYEKAVAEHTKLDYAERVKMEGGHLVGSDSRFSDVLTDHYTLLELRIETPTSHPVHVIEAATAPGYTPPDGHCAWRYTLWIEETTGALLHYKGDTPDERRPVCADSRKEVWYQIVNGLPRPFRLEERFHLPANKNGTAIRTFEGEETYAHFRKFGATVTFRTGSVIPPEAPEATPTPVPAP